MPEALPIDEVLPRLREALSTTNNVVLSAPPGAGKTTRVPPSLLDAPWLAGKSIIMLEPRRLAAQRAATYMASQLNETAGMTVGYRIRGESRVGQKTRVEVLTEGILTRRLQNEPELGEIGLVIFDEFHERSIHADLGLALTLDVQTHLRQDLRVLVMSATLDGCAVAQVLGDAPVVESAGRAHPVKTVYGDRPYNGSVEQETARAVSRALREGEGDVLVFLPGQREIRRVKELLGGLPPEVAVHSLFGEAPPGEQRSALATPPPGMRKVILSTSIAETSLTIDGVRIVIDAGLARSSRFDPRREMSGLVTTTVSRAAADQRRGRAGRQAPGICYRLWTEDQNAALPRYATPEILTADLTPLALELARWGAGDDQSLRFIDPPSPPRLKQARTILTNLGALDGRGILTPHGRAMSDLPAHPRLAHMIIRGKDKGIGSLACDVAALLEERDILRGGAQQEVDLASRIDALREGGEGDRVIRARVRAEANRLREIAGVREAEVDVSRAGILLALAYPERIARRRGTGYQTAGGTGAVLPGGSLLAREEFLALADVDGLLTNARIFLAAPLGEDDLFNTFGDRIVSEEQVYWSEADEAVVAREVMRLDALVLREGSVRPQGDAVRDAMVEGVRSLGLQALPWDRSSESIRGRSEWLRKRRLTGEGWPDLSDEHLHAALSDWLGPFLERMTRRPQLRVLDMTAVVKAMFTFAQIRELDRLAPETVAVPSGSHIRLDYTQGDQPVLAVRLQEMFGLSDTPTVALGKIPVQIHLLSPAHRPLAVTQDLRSFWMNAYTEVRKEMRGRYPKHVWPEDPMAEKPTRRTKKATKR